MKILVPSPPPIPSADCFSSPTSPELRQVAVRRSSCSSTPPELLLPPLPLQGGPTSPGEVYVAVGRSPEKTKLLLRWAFQHLDHRGLVLLHVHQPSPTIPTLLGRLPASQADEAVAMAYRRAEREDAKTALLGYARMCCQSQLRPRVVMTVSDSIPKGILELVTKYEIQKLVIGTTTNNCLNLKGRRTGTENFLSKNSPSFCEICFISRGKLIWTKESNHVMSLEHIRSLEFPRSSSSISPVLHFETEIAQDESPNISSIIDNSNISDSRIPTASASAGSSSSFASDARFSSPGGAQVEPIRSGLCRQLEEVLAEAERSKTEALAEYLRHKDFKYEAAEALKRVEEIEDACARETKLREDLEYQLSSVKLQKEVLLLQLDQAISDCIANCSHCAEEISRKSELGLNCRNHKMRSQGEGDILSVKDSEHCKMVAGYRGDSFRLVEFSALDLQLATCDYSENFRINHGSFGFVYKGEILDQTVAVKRADLHNYQGNFEFEQEVYVLGRLRHPNLLSLLGLCPEERSLVFEYLPNGSLHDHLFGRTMAPPLDWKTRIRVASEVAAVLLYLHSSKPEKIVHGNLRPHCVLFDSQFCSKIFGFGTCRLMPGDGESSSVIGFSIDPEAEFSFADPGYKGLSTKSDVFSFGLILLQLLTAKPTAGLVQEVRRALSGGSIQLVLDPTVPDWPESSAARLAKLALEFTTMNPCNRPELTPALVKELQELYRGEERPVPPFFLCPILQEVMHHPVTAADGFTYEGTAIRWWLETGHETSPMTNLHLDHLGLTPNHAMRFAIHDWLCQPWGMKNCRSS